MLHRKLLARLGLLVLGFIAGAVVSITLLQNSLSHLEALNAKTSVMIDGSQRMSAAIGAIEARAAGADPAVGVASSEVEREGEIVGRELAALAPFPSMSPGAGASAEALAELGELTGRLFAPGASFGIADALELQRRAQRLASLTRAEIARDQAAQSRGLRALIVGLTIAALVMVNITIFVLLRTSSMILRPVSALVEGSRRLAREDFGYRVRLDQRDEFAQLATEYNRLADQLSLNEKRKIEALHHLAVTLNHELNNVLNIIDLQLDLLGRRSGGNAALSGYLFEIHNNLARIARTIASLRDVRRIVLTDYGTGELMLDLPRSLAAEEPPRPAPAGAGLGERAAEGEGARGTLP